MLPVSFSRSRRTPLDFDTDRTARVADAPPTATGEFRTAVAPADAESLLEHLGLSGHVARAIVAERSGSGALE